MTPHARFVLPGAKLDLTNSDKLPSLVLRLFPPSQALCLGSGQAGHRRELPKGWRFWVLGTRPRTTEHVGIKTQQEALQQAETSERPSALTRVGEAENQRLQRLVITDCSANPSLSEMWVKSRSVCWR